MKCYQTRGDGVFVGTTHADPNPLEKDQFILPGGCLFNAPPKFPAGQQARWDGKKWIIEKSGTNFMTQDKPPKGAAISWDGCDFQVSLFEAPPINDDQTAVWDGVSWKVETKPVVASKTLSVAEKLASVGLSVDELKSALK